MEKAQILPVQKIPVENCGTCGQEPCDSPIIVQKGKKRLHFCSGDCEAMYAAQDGGK